MTELSTTQLPVFVRLSDLRRAGIVRSQRQLRILIERAGFPIGRRLGLRARAWTVREIEDWIASRPTEKFAPPLRKPGRPRKAPAAAQADTKPSRPPILARKPRGRSGAANAGL